MSIIKFMPSGRRLEARNGQTVMQVARILLDPENGGVSAPCGGKGVCGRCKVRLVEGELSPPNEIEIKLLGEKDIDRGYRLACQAKITGPAKFEIPEQTASKGQQLQLEGDLSMVAVETVTKKYTVSLRATTVNYPHSLWQQVEASLAGELGISNLRIDTRLAGDVETIASDGQVTVTMRGNEIINLDRGNRPAKSAGFAVDLGSTKIAGFLVNTETGETIAADGILNPQISYGEDIISRLVFAMEGENQYNRITQTLREGLGKLLQRLCQAAAVEPEDVVESVIVGNTAMHHLLLGLPVHQLARSPYVPAVTLPVEVKGRTLGLNMAPGAYVYLVPPVAGFVGGDHVAMVLGSRVYEAAGITLGLDIGTNTEIVLARDGDMISCSCASGPAFEGAHVQQGMRAVEGAISEVYEAAEGGRLNYKTVGDKPPLGFCGSGILDAVAELYKTGVISNNGRLDSSNSRVRFNPERKTPEYLLVSKKEGGTENDIVITQKDISEILLAKAAIAAAIKVLLSMTGLKEMDIDRVIIAGAFGTHLKLTSAISIGMLPDIPLERYRQVGNAAGVGARMALLSSTERFKTERIARMIKYVELSNTKAFGDYFLKQMRFPEKT